MNPLDSSRKEHSKTEFGKKNEFLEKVRESETFPGSKFSPATSVHHGRILVSEST